MTDLTLICPDCGGAILHQCVPQSSSNLDAIPSSNGQIARRSEALTKDGRQSYNQDYPADFLTFWNIYPRHRDKRKALKAWRNAIQRAPQAQINAGAIRYRDDPNRVEQFTKYAEGWLNADGWLDEPLPPRQPALGWLDETYRRATHGGP